MTFTAYPSKPVGVHLKEQHPMRNQTPPPSRTVQPDVVAMAERIVFLEAELDRANTLIQGALAILTVPSRR